MQTPHTPGPWTIDTNMRGLHNVPVIGVRSGDEAVANCGTSGDANARLIAAAPDLLAALQALVQRLDPLGEDAPDSAECRVCGKHPGSHAPDCPVSIAKQAIAKATDQ